MKSFQEKQEKDNGKEIHQFMIQMQFIHSGQRKWGIKTSNNVERFSQKNRQ
jgi:hypothetical protein